MRRAMQALSEFAHILRKYEVPVRDIHAVATAAMREAGNGEAFTAHVRDATGIDIRIIDGNTEAVAALKGATAVLTPGTIQSILLFDIGGASTEFIRADESGLTDAVSRKIGVVRLVEAHLKTDPPSAQDYRAMVHEVGEHLTKVAACWSDDRIPDHLVGTAGTVTTLAAVDMELAPYDAARVNNHRMARTRLYQLRDRLLAMTHAEREAIPAIEPGRADLIIAGLAIIEAVIARWNFNELITVDAGLLEGIWLDLASRQPSAVK
jgi:exopolyphosphatase/guanosine-5'-triphosphate,3'-diphosphate pyrophosphatase